MGSFYFLRIFSVLPRPVSPLVNPPPGGVLTATQKPTERPERRRGTSTHTSKKSAVKRQQNAPQRTPAQTVPTQHETKHRHRTRAAIQDYTLQQPGRSSRPQGSPNGDPQTAQQRAETPPGCNGSPHRPKPPTAAHRRHGGQQKTPRAEARSVAPYLFIFNRSAKTTNGKIKMQSKIKSFHPLTEP